jgi:hypothetical protein
MRSLFSPTRLLQITGVDGFTQKRQLEIFATLPTGTRLDPPAADRTAGSPTRGFHELEITVARSPVLAIAIVQISPIDHSTAV